MPANLCTPFFTESNISFQATADVTGKRFVNISANRSGGPGLSSDKRNIHKMAHAATGGRAFGVAEYDVATGDVGGVFGQPGMIVPVTADGVITAGAEISVGSNGKAKVATAAVQSGTTPFAVTPGTVVVGIAVTGAADGADAEIKLI